MTAVRVLVLADHSVVRWGLARLVAAANNSQIELACSVSSVPEALDILAKEPVDVIVAHLDQDGRISTEAIESLVKKSGAKVLLLTWVREPVELDRAVLAGASGVILKDCDPTTIPMAIEKVRRGELWLDRATTTRILVALSKQSGQGSKDGAAMQVNALTPKERQVVAALAKDVRATTRSVAARLSISEHTLRNHLVAIYGKLGVTSRLELWDYANKHGLATRDS